MLIKTLILTLIIFFNSEAFANNGKVIFITIDGVQRENITEEYLPKTLALVKESGILLGTTLKTRMVVANSVSKSLPGYRSILSGKYESECKNNECPQIKTPTLIDQYFDNSVVFASWERIARAVTNNASRMPEGSITFHGFSSTHVDANTTATIESILKESESDLPIWKEARFDHYTWEIAMTYFKSHIPRLSYLSFLDTDEWAHHRSFPGVENALREFDIRFSNLIQFLKDTDPKGYENTSFVITTDHGRGKYALWTTHGKIYKHSKQVFAMIIPSLNIRNQFKVTPGKQVPFYNHLQIRPTIELLLNSENTNKKSNALIEMSDQKLPKKHK